MKKSIITAAIAILSLGALMAFGDGWKNPNTQPPSGNPPIFLNSGSGGQAINAGLWLNHDLVTGGAGVSAKGLIVPLGNVGIGDKNPSERLVVNGNLSIVDGAIKPVGFVGSDDYVLVNRNGISMAWEPRYSWISLTSYGSQAMPSPSPSPQPVTCLLWGPYGPLNVPVNITLNWTTTGNPIICSASGGWGGTKDANGGTDPSVFLNGPTTYNLTCTNSSGQSGSCSFEYVQIGGGYYGTGSGAGGSGSGCGDIGGLQCSGYCAPLNCPDGTKWPQWCVLKNATTCGCAGTACPPPGGGQGGGSGTEPSPSPSPSPSPTLSPGCGNGQADPGEQCGDTGTPGCGPVTGFCPDGEPMPPPQCNNCLCYYPPCGEVRAPEKNFFARLFDNIFGLAAKPKQTAPPVEDTTSAENSSFLAQVSGGPCAGVQEPQNCPSGFTEHSLVCTQLQGGNKLLVRNCYTNKNQ